VSSHTTRRWSFHTFEAIDSARVVLCPEGSYQSALIGLVRIWPTPCVLVEAKWAGKKATDPGEYFSSFALRAVGALVNDSARMQGIQFHKNFRVPVQSVIHKVFSESLLEGAAVEDLSWWESSDGTSLGKRQTSVSAKRVGDTIYGLLVPQRVVPRL
jgi:hypothetical protein